VRQPGRILQNECDREALQSHYLRGVVNK